MANAIKSQEFVFGIGNEDSPLTYTTVSEVVSFSGLDGQASEIDVTHLQSTAKEFLMGLQDFGNFSLECNFLPDDSGQDKMRAAQASSDIQDFKATLSDATVITFQGFVLQSTIAGGVDAKVDTSFNIRISGNVTIS